MAASIGGGKEPLQKHIWLKKQKLTISIIVFKKRYAGNDYEQKSGVQMDAIYQMCKRLGL